MIPFVYDDGGAKAAGMKGEAGDCFARAVAIATRLDYLEVCTLIRAEASRERASKRKRGKSTPRSGVYKGTAKRILARRLGWVWTPTMLVGSGCRVHLRADELPSGRLIVRVSKHFCAVLDGVLHDTRNGSRAGTRCVYGYWRAP